MHPALVKLGAPQELLSKRIICFQDEVNGRNTDLLGAAIVLLNSRSETDPIVLYLTSGGGHYSPGLDMYDILSHSKAPVTGIVFRYASSMAALVLQACKKRKMFAHARMMIHGVQKTTTFTEVNLRDPKWVAEALEEFQRRNAALTNIYMRRTKQTEEVVQKWLSRDTEFSAKEALAVGLIDEII